MKVFIGPEMKANRRVRAYPFSPDDEGAKHTSLKPEPRSALESPAILATGAAYKAILRNGIGPEFWNPSENPRSYVSGELPYFGAKHLFLELVVHLLCDANMPTFFAQNRCRR